MNEIKKVEPAKSPEVAAPQAEATTPEALLEAVQSNPQAL